MQLRQTTASPGTKATSLNVCALIILQEIMAEEHIQALVEMIEVKDEVEAECYQFYGSPTIYVDLTPFRATRFAEGKLWQEEFTYGLVPPTAAR